MKCPKCQYVRTAGDTCPSYECPKCGIIYAKFDPTEGERETELRARLTKRARSIKTVATTSHSEKVTNCPACGGLVAYGIKACLHCGKTKPAPIPSRPVGRLGLALFGVFTVGMVFNAANSHNTSTGSDSANQANDPAVRLGAQATVQTAGYRCGTVTHMTKLMIGTGFSVHCDNYKDNYTITDEGGRIHVRLD